MTSSLRDAIRYFVTTSVALLLLLPKCPDLSRSRIQEWANSFSANGLRHPHGLPPLSLLITKRNFGWRVVLYGSLQAYRLSVSVGRTVIAYWPGQRHKKKTGCSNETLLATLQLGSNVTSRCWRRVKVTQYVNLWIVSNSLTVINIGSNG